MKVLHEHTITSPSGNSADLVLRMRDDGELEHHMVCTDCRAENVIPATTPEADAEIFLAWLAEHIHKDVGVVN